jgi:hypothetical protein
MPLVIFAYLIIYRGRRYEINTLAFRHYVSVFFFIFKLACLRWLTKMTQDASLRLVRSPEVVRKRYHGKKRTVNKRFHVALFCLCSGVALFAQARTLLLTLVWVPMRDPKGQCLPALLLEPSASSGSEVRFHPHAPKKKGGKKQSTPVPNTSLIRHSSR